MLSIICNVWVRRFVSTRNKNFCKLFWRLLFKPPKMIPNCVLSWNPRNPILEASTLTIFAPLITETFWPSERRLLMPTIWLSSVEGWACQFPWCTLRMKASMSERLKKTPNWTLRWFSGAREYMSGSWLKSNRNLNSLSKMWCQTKHRILVECGTIILWFRNLWKSSTTIAASPGKKILTPSSSFVALKNIDVSCNQEWSFRSSGINV